MINKDCGEFEDFNKKYGDDVTIDILERICDCGWQGSDCHGIKISSTHRHDAINCTLTGSFTHDDIEYGFIMDSGNWAGDVMLEFGPIDDVGEYTPPKPTMYTFVPKNDFLEQENPQMYGVYKVWSEEPWFKEQIGKYMYDKHFEPTEKTEKYYREWADKKGLKIVTVAEDSE